MKSPIVLARKDQVDNLIAWMKHWQNELDLDVSVKILYEDERRLLRKNTNKDSLNSESSSDSEEREGSSSHQGK